MGGNLCLCNWLCTSTKYIFVIVSGLCVVVLVSFQPVIILVTLIV